MKLLLTPAIMLAAMGAGFLIFLARSAALLPERMATNFGADGHPNGSLDRLAYLLITGGLGVLLSMVFVTIGMVVRPHPARFFNIPNREYWLSPKRWVDTGNYICGQMLWLACLTVSFLAAMHYVMMEANRVTPAHLPRLLFLGVVGTFLIATTAWALIFWRHFAGALRRGVPADEQIAESGSPSLHCIGMPA